MVVGIISAIFTTTITFLNTQDLGIYTKEVLIIQAYERDYAHTRELEIGIENSLSQFPDNIKIRYEFLDTKNHFSRASFEDYRDIFKRKYQNLSLDGIILCDDDALNFFRDYGEEIFGSKVPVVATGINSVTNYKEGVQGITILEERPNYEKNIELVLFQNPKVDTIHFIYDDTTTSLQVHGDLVPLLNQYYPTLKHQHHLDKTPEQLKQLVQSAQPNEVFFIVIYSRDPEGEVFVYDEVSKYLTADAPVPIYVFWEFYMNSGVVGGFVASSEKYGESAANTLLNLWNGKTLPAILYEKGLNHRYMFDYTVLNRYNITKIPDNALLINKPLTLWERHKTIIIFFSIVTTLLATIIVLQLRIAKAHRRENKLLKEAEDVQKNINAKLEEEVDKRTEAYQLLNTKLELALLMTEDKNKEISNMNHQLKESFKTLKETQHRLVETEKIASLGSLVAGISHEINTPLGISLTGASFIDEQLHQTYDKYRTQTLKKSELDYFFKTSLETNANVLESLKQSVNLVNSFKKIAISQECESTESFDLSDYIKEVVVSLSPRLKNHNIQILLDCDQVILFKGDPSWFFQILNQLIDNSIRHGFAEKQGDKLIVVELMSMAKEVVLKYYDNGIGIDEILLNKIFEPFYTTKRNDGDGGIGLNMIFNLVVGGLKGTITCESNLNEGMAFVIRFPNPIEQKDS